MPSETTTAFVSLLVFFTNRRGTFPYSVEDDASTVSQIPTTHYTNICVKLTIVTYLSFSERIAIANLSCTSQEELCQRHKYVFPRAKVADTHLIDTLLKLLTIHTYCNHVMMFVYCCA